MSDSEYHIIAIQYHGGARKVKRFDHLHVPLEAARGHFEKLSDLALREMTNDLLAERERRDNGEPAILGRWDPLDAIITHPGNLADIDNED